MLLKYFYDEKLAHASYLVGCQATGEAIVVDPGRDIAPYLAAAKARGLTVTAATETHIHADFVSGSRELAAQVGAKLYLSDEGDALWKYQFLEDYQHELLKDGDTFKIGNIKFEVMHTPGHTPEHIALLVTDTVGADQPIGIFTGDFVFVGDVGRPDLLEEAAGMAGTAEPGARQMFQSLQRFKQLPDYLQLWPAHGAGSACGKALGAVPSSTVGYEKRFNAALSFSDEEKFVKNLLAGQPEAPRYFGMMKKLNKEGPAVLGKLSVPRQLAPERLQMLLESGAIVIDTRPADQFAAGHIPGTLNIPEDDAFTNWAGWLLDYDKPFYLITHPAVVKETVHDLIYIGLDNIGGYFDATMVANWANLQSYRATTPSEIADKVANGEVTVVDVRAISEWNEGHIPGARHYMLGHLMQQAANLPGEKPLIVHCQANTRSSIGVSVLQAKGFKEVFRLEDGIQGWAAAGLPLERNL